jgi:hypothetical protein
MITETKNVNFDINAEKQKKQEGSNNITPMMGVDFDTHYKNLGVIIFKLIFKFSLYLFLFFVLLSLTLFIHLNRQLF